MLKIQFINVLQDTQKYLHSIYKLNLYNEKCYYQDLRGLII